MGMSASQARFLSITSRLSDNELQSQTITTAKMSLANRTTEASATYMDALSQTQLLFSTYDDKGNKIQQPLTGTCLTQYAPLKNQYGLVNNKGQILVSELDAENYKNSANIGEFLTKYGFSNSFTEETHTVIDEGEYMTSEQYKEWKIKYDAYKKELEDWQGREPLQKDYQKEIITPGYKLPYPNEGDYMIDDPNFDPGSSDAEVWSLYEAFMTSTAGGCFTCSSNPASSEYNKVRHFNHTLAHMLVGGYNDVWQGNLWWNKPGGGINSTEGDGALMAKIAEALVGKTCCGTSSCNGQHSHEWFGNNVNLDCGGISCDGNELITDKIKKLMEDIAAYAGGDYGKVGDDSDPEWISIKQRYYHLIEHDLQGVLADITIPKDPPQILDEEAYKKALEEYENSYYETITYEPNVQAYEEAHKAWEEEGKLIQEPVEDKTHFEQTITTIHVDAESDEGQWYINLWHRMNGPSNYKTTIAGVDNGIHDPDNDGTVTGDNVTSPTNGVTENGEVLWKVLEDGLMNSSDWLKYALEKGLVTIERVDFTDPTEYGTGLENENYTWTSLIYTNIVDITEEQNEAAITKAEVEYEQALRDIEAKDKQYDNQLKLLDSEHNALQTEYDSIKGVIEKNIERTLKIYS